MDSTRSDSNARARLIEKHRSFARNIAMKHAADLPLEFEDAVQVAYEGLCIAAERFDFSKHDPEKGDIDTIFKSFAYLRIYGAVIDEARRNTFVRRRGIEKGLRTQFVSIDDYIEIDGSDIPRIELVAVTGDADLVIDFEAAMGTLSDREQHVVLALAAGAKGRELAEELSLTESRVSQINSEAKAKLLNYMEVAA